MLNGAVEKKSGSENFINGPTAQAAKLIDFWQWSASDLLSNTCRGILAEFIVATALGTTDKPRQEWDSFDLATKNGIKVEVKSCAYRQSWKQRKLSKITFKIPKTKGYANDTVSYAGKPKRHADCYIFCLLTHTDLTLINPLDLSQWVFYVLPTYILDELGDQKSLALSRVKDLGAIETTYAGIASAVAKSTIPRKT